MPSRGEQNKIHKFRSTLCIKLELDNTITIENKDTINDIQS